MKIKRKVVMLPTNEKASLVLNQFNGLQLSSKIGDKYNQGSIQNIDLSNHVYQHLYIFSDEEIKEGEILPYLMKWENGYELFNSNNGIRKSKVDRAKRIIATTDKSLGLPEPSPEFVEVFIREYNKGNVIEEVMVEYETRLEQVYSHSGNKIQEESEPYLKVDKNNYITITKMKDSWSREEVVTLCMKIQHETTVYKQSCHYGPNLRELAEWTSNWIEQNL